MGGRRQRALVPLAVIDPSRQWRLEAAMLHARHRHSPFVEREFVGWVERVLVRGCTVAVDGEILGVPRGQWLRPEPMC